jgi:N-acetylmuramoyl-L-alanine amidase
MDSIDYSSLPFPVRVDLVPAGQTNQRTGIALNPRFITIHETDNPNMGAAGHNRWLHDGAPDDHGNSQQLSVHFFVDDRGAFQCIPLDEVGWHAGDSDGPGNMTSLAIETCVNRDADFDRTRGNVALLTALLMEKFDIPSENIVQHNRWSGKDCPKRMRHENLWADELERIQDAIKKPLFQPFGEVRTYHVPADRRATGRARPSRNAPEVETFEEGTEIACDGTFRGQEVEGDATWLRTADDRHLAIHASGLAEGRAPVARHRQAVPVGGGA